MTMPSLPPSVASAANAAGLPTSIPGLPYGDPTGMLSNLVSQTPFSLTDPTVASAVGSIQQAAAAEGLDPTASSEVKARLQLLFSTAQQIYQNPSYYGVAETALGAARKFVSQNKELSGAVSTVQGLVTAFQNASRGGATPPDIAAAFSGPVVALAVASGAFSAGVGALITAGVAIAAEALDAAGVFAPKPGTQICPGFQYTGGGTPSFAISCMAVFDQTGGAISPGSANWRRFPSPKNPDDAWWFAPMPEQGNGTYTTWNNAKWIPEPVSLGTVQLAIGALGFRIPVDFLRTPVNAAFGAWWFVSANSGSPNYSDYGKTLAQTRDPSSLFAAMSERGTLPSSLSNEQKTALLAFDGAFAKAWEANAEYFLNGLKGAPDGNVLMHVAELWNRAHAPGEGVWVAQPGAFLGGHEQESVYWATLAGQAVNSANSDILTPDGRHLFIHTGPLKSTQNPPGLRLPSLLGAKLLPVLPKYTSSSAKGSRSPALLVGTLALGGAALFAGRRILTALRSRAPKPSASG